MRKLMAGFATLALAVASAATYDINIPDPVSSGDKKLYAGQYTVQVQGEKAVFTKGKLVVELPVAVEDGARKHPSNQVNTSGAELRDISVGGTKLKLIFKPQAPGAPAGGGAK